MTTVKITSPAGKTAGALALPAEVFDAQANIPLMHQVVTAQLAAARQGTHSTKTRGDVSGGGKKPYKQKGTGRARQGSTRAPQFTGGGISHGPVPHGYAQRTPKKMKAAALRGALSDRAREGRVHVLSAVVDGDVPSTKAAVATLAALGAERNLLVVVDREDETGWKSLRNVPSVHLLAADQLNTYDVLCSDHVIFTRAALDEFLVVHRAPAATEAEVADVTDAEVTEAAEVTDAEVTEAAVTDAAAATDGDEVLADSAIADESGSDADAPAARDFGPGSHAPLSDGSQPDGFPIKGNADSMLYHVPGSSHYARTVAEVWFDTAESAQAAGFQLPPSQRKVADEAAADEAAADEAAADEEESK